MDKTGRDKTATRTMQISAWARVEADTKIISHVEQKTDTAEFDIGGCNGLCLEASEAGLRRLVAVCTDALGKFAAAGPVQVDDIPSEHGAEPA